jgi:hypothetical protein
VIKLTILTLAGGMALTCKGLGNLEALDHQEDD